MVSKNKKTEIELLGEINKKLDKLGVIARLLSLNLPQEMNQQHKIQILSESGVQPKDIAQILGTTSNTVKVALNRLKKKKTSTK